MGSANSTDLTGKTSIVIDLKNVKALDLNKILDELSIDTGIKWSFGTGLNQANLLFHDSDSTDETGKTVDVNAGSLKNAFGDAITMEAIKLLYVKNTHETLTLLVLGTAITAIPICADPSDIIEIPPGGFQLWVCPTAAGLDVTTNCNLKFAAKTAGTITFDYAMLGLD